MYMHDSMELFCFADQLEGSSKPESASSLLFDASASSSWNVGLTHSDSTSCDGATDAIGSTARVSILDAGSSSQAIDSMALNSNSNQHGASGAQTVTSMDAGIGRDVGSSCVVCLEDFDDDALYIHSTCGCLLCGDCIGKLKFHFDSAECGQCPQCSAIVNFDEEFVTVDVITGKTHRSRCGKTSSIFSTF